MSNFLHCCGLLKFLITASFALSVGFVIVNGGLGVYVPIQIQAQPEAESSSNRDMSAAVEQLASSVQNSVVNVRRSGDSTVSVTCRSLAATFESHSVAQSSSNNVTCAVEAGDRLSSSLHVSGQSTTDARAVEVLSSSKKDSKSSPVKRTQRSSMPYVYTAIKDVKPGTSVNLFGVVKFVRPASRGRGTGE